MCFLKRNNIKNHYTFPTIRISADSLFYASVCSIWVWNTFKTPSWAQVRHERYFNMWAFGDEITNELNKNNICLTHHEWFWSTKPLHKRWSNSARVCARTRACLCCQWVQLQLDPDINNTRTAKRPECPAVFSSWWEPSPRLQAETQTIKVKLTGKNSKSSGMRI